MSESTDPEAVPPETAAATRSADPRQRWRLVVARDGGGTAAADPQRDVAEAWLATLEAAGLPLARTEGARARARVSFGAPIPVGMAADGELIDVVLTERWPAWRVRELLDGRLPAGWRLVELNDVWLAGPPLAGRVAAADYRITLAASPAIDPAGLRDAAQTLLAASRIVRQRAKGAGTVDYDLRALLVDVGVADAGPPVVIETRTRFHPELGTGRPEEVVAALGDHVGVSLEIASIVRERLVLAEDLD